MRYETWILPGCLAALLAAGCGALGAGAEGTQDGGTQFDGAGTHCACVLSLSTHTPAPGDVVVAEVAATVGIGPYVYDWSVTHATGVGVTVDPRNSAGTQIEFTIGEAGSYLVSVDQTTATGERCRTSDSLLAKNPVGKTDTVLLRFTPPAGSSIPVQEKKFGITGGTPQADLAFTLQPGILLDLPLTDDGGDTAPAFVRLIANVSGFETEAYVHAGAALQVLVLDDNYDVLVIPDEASPKRFAPTLAANQPLFTLTPANARLTLDPGVVVSGNVSAAGGVVEGARVLLTRGRLPSTVGVADAAGGYSVRVQAGTGFGVSVSPPAASGLPDLELADGVDVDALGSAVDVEYDAAVQPEADLTATVLSHTNVPTQLVAGARVTLRGEIAVAGRVKVGGVELPAPGVVRRVATTDAAGVVSFAGLPHGDYDLVVEPLGHGLADDATTRARVTVPSGAVTLALFRKVTLSGTLERPASLGSGDLAGTTVQAVLQVGTGAAVLGAAPAASADPGGTFGVRVDPADPADPVEYAIIADPPAASGMARAMRVIQLASLDDVALQPLSLPRGLILAGTVQPEYGAPLAGVYVEAFRYRAPGEEDPAARAECVTDSSGHFSLVFSDPDDLD